MKKRRLLLFFILLALIFSFGGVAFGEEESVERKLEEELDAQLDALDLREFEQFVKRLDGQTFSDGFGDAVKKLLDGEEVFSLSTISELIGENVLKELLFGVPICASIILICVLSSTLSRFSSKITGNATENIVKFVCYCSVLIILVSAVYSLADSVKDTILSITTFMNIIFPVLVTLLAIVGGSGSAGLFSPYLAILSSGLVNGLNGIIIPIFFACITMSIVGGVTDSVKLDGLRKGLKSCCDWLLGLGFGVFCTFLTGQSILTGGIDGVTVKATKFALSSYVPVLGGYLSDGFDIVLAGSVLIKNAIGITGIFVILFLVLAPLLKLVVFSVILKISSGVAQTIGDHKISNLLSGVSSTIGMLISLLLGTAFVFFFVVILIVYTVNGGVI